MHARRDGFLRILVRIDVLDVNLGGSVGVLLELVFGSAETRALAVIGDGSGLLEFADDFQRLVGKTVALVGSGIVRAVVAVRENVADGENAKHNDDVDGREADVFGLAGFQEVELHGARPSTAEIPSSARSKTSRWR